MEKILKTNFNILKVIFFISIIFSIFNFSQAQSPDALAIRVIKNPAHLSALDWYNEQGFNGSPQSLTVDGYEAVRDGRTVYVNAANVIGTDFYTNIYLISYNQDAEEATVDIFGQMLNHWKFNHNITEVGNCIDKQGYLGDSCRVDSDCHIEHICNSEKAEITRDTIRLSDLVKIEMSLEEHRQINGKYPLFSAGSYLPHITISTWPSWQIMTEELNTQVSVDPINDMGDCGGGGNYNQQTCWDEYNLKFADQNTNTPELDLPLCSFVYKYETNEDGSEYDLCGTLESDSAINNLGNFFQCSEEPMQFQMFRTIQENSPPVFLSHNLVGVEFQEFKGYIEATDIDGDILSWSIISPPLGWSNPIIIQKISGVDQIVLYSSLAPAAGTYNILIEINDNNGGITNRDFEIFIGSLLNLPAITNITGTGVTNPEPDTYNVSVNIGHNLDLRVLAHSPANNLPLSFRFNNYIEPAGFGGYVDTNNTDFIINTPISGSIGTYHKTVYPIDSLGNKGKAVVLNIEVNNSPPLYTGNNSFTVTGCTTVDLTERPTFSDPENHAIIYSAENLPTGMSIVPSSGELTGNPVVVADSYTSTITATDQYGAKTSVEITIIVVDDVITLTDLPNETIHAYANNGLGLYEKDNLQYNHRVDASSDNIVSYELIYTELDPDQIGFSVYPTPTFRVAVNAQGEIMGVATENTDARPEPYDFTVRAQNACYVTGTTDFSIRVEKNSWCGDDEVDLQFEDCDFRGVNLTATSAFNQYECIDCAWFGGWCGNSKTQDMYGEECDILDRVAQAPAESNSFVQYECDDLCKFTGGYCGDDTTQINYGETCDGIDNVATTTQGSSIDNQYGCDELCRTSGGYCGDGNVYLALEECEFDGGGLNASDQYLCTDCLWDGGWCGDRSTQTGYEDCDGGIGASTCGSVPGFVGGALGCRSDCFFDTSGCCTNYKFTFSNGTVLNSDSLTVTFDFDAIGDGEAGGVVPSINVNGFVKAGKSVTFDRAVRLGNNTITIFSNDWSNDSCDDCTHDGVLGEVTTSAGSYVYTTSDNQEMTDTRGNLYETYECTNGYIQTKCCSNCCNTQFRTSFNVVCE